MLPKMPSEFMKPPTQAYQEPTGIDTSKVREQWMQQKRVKNQPSPRIQKLREAGNHAIQSHKQLQGIPAVDPDVKIYMGLSQEDLHRMVQEYGVNEVGRYVQTMEARRLGGR